MRDPQEPGYPEVLAALRADGYKRVDSVTLPDHRVLGIWWKNRGSLAPG